MRAIMSAVSDDLLAWRTRTGVDRFDEMWPGVLHLNRAPDGDHQLLQDDLREWLKHWWARPHQAKAMCQRNVARPEEWPHNYRIPDIVLISPDRQHFDVGDYIAGPPLVVIEIRSPDDESYEKLPFYAEIGIPEVWILDQDSESTDILISSEDNYTSAPPDDQGWTTSPATKVMMRFSADRRLTVRIEASTESYRELPED